MMQVKHLTSKLDIIKKIVQKYQKVHMKLQLPVKWKKEKKKNAPLIRITLLEFNF